MRVEIQASSDVEIGEDEIAILSDPTIRKAGRVSIETAV